MASNYKPQTEKEARNRADPKSATAIAPTDSQLEAWEKQPEAFLENWYEKQRQKDPVDHLRRATYLIQQGYPVPSQDPQELARIMQKEEERRTRPKPPPIFR